jgi:hypothetical protein
MINFIASIAILLMPIFIGCSVAKFCWQQGWLGRLAFIICTSLISLHTHAYYFPNKPLKDRYALMLLEIHTSGYSQLSTKAVNNFVYE